MVTGITHEYMKTDLRKVSTEHRKYFRIWFALYHPTWLNRLDRVCCLVFGHRFYRPTRWLVLDDGTGIDQSKCKYCDAFQGTDHGLCSVPHG